MKPILIFDLDGTLIDSAPDLHAAASRLLEREGHPPLSLTTIRSFIGNGIPVLVERIVATAGLDPLDHPRLVAAFLEDYLAHSTDLTGPYPGVVEVLAELKQSGFVLGVCTNKPHRPAEKILEDLGLAAFFDGLIGGDTLKTRKPEPDGLLLLKDSLGGGPIVYVGDSEVDAETSRRAGIPFALFEAGYRKTAVSEIPHDASFSTFRELPAVARVLLPVPA
ncbi:phosphoglycolate phosphatase [Roseibium aggregatum]|uniref:Phosphoglycolate phosphatase n=1 Tax=Roseibium aggregatum TaxID=187304 RepID=A0A939EGV1_9HYPH|nr:phosphoglycolate phosphatase [Roseibium aggregatum]MBN9672977.1 phosphoglycolate phosphatase [Roseibium aggregatum]